jgi:hypothetical protein
MAAEEERAVTQAEEETAQEAAAPAAPPAEGEGGEAGVAGEVPPLPQTVPDADRVIREGTIALEVEEGEFDPAYARVVEAARRLGGSVAASTTRTQDDGSGTFGSLTVRVPVENYEDLLVDVAEIGTVRQRDITATDVSEEYVDLQSRQRNLEAQERFYLGLLDRADDVSDAISIQQQLTGITEQLEQIKGRIAFLDDRTSFSTLTVELFEPGTAFPASEEPSGRPELARFWAEARDAFVNVVGATMVAAAFLAPLALLGLVVFAIVRLTMGRRPAKAPAPPLPEREREPIG